MRVFAIIISVAVITTGCTLTDRINTAESTEKATQQQAWHVSPTFELSTEVVHDGQAKDITNQWFGEKGKVAITANPFIVGKPQKYMWLFWGNKDDILGKKFKVIATSTKGEQQTVLSGDALSGENWGAPASYPSLISLPTPGVWRLDAYIDDKLHGNIIVEVK